MLTNFFFYMETYMFKAIKILVVLRLAEHILALLVTGLIVTTSLLQYSNML